MIAELRDRANAAITARLFWDTATLLEIFQPDDKDVVIDAEIDELVDIAGELLRSHNLELRRDAKLASNRYTREHFRQFIELLDTQHPSGRRRHVQPGDLDGVRFAGLDVCALLVHAVGHDWWTQRMTARALAAA